MGIAGKLAQVAAIAAILSGSATALAETALRVIVPFAPGGGGDLLARTLAPELARELQIPVVIENVPGANGVVAMTRVKNAGRQERVLVLASDHAAVLAPLISTVARYDTRKDLAMVAVAARFPYVLAAMPGTARSLDSLRMALSDRQSLASIAVPAEGGLPELIADAMARAAGVPVTSVPFKGGSPAVTALLGGQVAAAAVGISNVLALHREEKVRILAVSGSRRSEAIPAVPTFEEVGIGDLHMTGAWALYASKETAMDVVALNRSVRAVLSQVAVRAKLRSMGLEPLSMDVQQSRKELESSTAAWANLLRQRQHRSTENP